MRLSGLLLILLAAGCQAQTSKRIPIVVSPRADGVEKFAARELSDYLGRMHAGRSFPVESAVPADYTAIFIGTLASNPELGKYVAKEKLTAPESFVVTHAGATGVVAGADPRGTLYGVYALLEKLGCGFYLSYDSIPAPRTTPFTFDAWRIEDAPLFADRIVFDWHNFLSSASSWELADWQRYIDQAAKMRFNTIMVHAYGNNPMFTFRHNGLAKPTGYLATTRSGRDWGTQHVNDVRRLIGGEVFNDAVFGASAARAPEEQRSAAAMDLMKKVFIHAGSRGMRVTFALDVDTESANPQNIIRTLPAGARFSDGKYEFANPDTPEGQAYYKAQARQLLDAYPQIDRLAIWFRTGGTPLRNLQVKSFPPAWQTEFEAACARTPRLRAAKDAPGMFAVAKVIRAFTRALGEIGRSDVEIATGSWNFPFLPAADALLPRSVTFIPLDWSTIFDTADGLKELRVLQPGRKLIPIVWAHHDDRTYIGRPYTPFANFSTLLKERAAQGFGIIHWTTRPLDFYFKSLAAQVWKATGDQSIGETCDQAAADAFGEPLRKAGAEYLLRFVTEAPMFGRETSNRFMDVPLKDPENAMAKSRERLTLLARIAEKGLNGRQLAQLHYYRDYEQFMLAFFESHTAWERAEAALKRGDIAQARAEIAKSKAEEVIAKYAEAARRGQISRGEEALIISLNLRWLPYIVSTRQALGLEPVRIKFGPTEHEPLAQGAGSNTFYVDDERKLWRQLGEKETGAPASGKAYTVKVGAIMGGQLLPGAYRLELQTLDAQNQLQRSVQIVNVDGGAYVLAVGADVRASGVVLEPVKN